MSFIKKHTQLFTRTLFVVFVMSFLVFPLIPAPVAQADAVTESAKQNEIPTTVNDIHASNFGCFKGGLSTTSIAGCTALLSYYLFLYPSFRISGWLGILFNVAFFKLVVGMGDAVKTMAGITDAWKILRDLTNVFLVFLLVFVGIATILGISGFGYKRLLWKIILAALLVNFSITFTKVIIDVTNLTAIAMYGEIIKLGYPGPASQEVLTSCLTGSGMKINDNPKLLESNLCAGNGVSGAFWNKLKVITVFDAFKNVDTAKEGAADVQWGLAWAALFGGIMFLVLAFVFGATAFFLIGRFVTLIFLIIISPIALVLWITGISSSGSKWWHTLLNQSIFAPLILLMWFIALKVLNGLDAQPLGSGSTPAPDTVSMVMTFIIAASFLIGGLIIAKKAGAYGASAAINTGKQWSRRVAMGVGAAAGATTVGLSAYALRQTAGRKAAHDANNDDLKYKASSANKNVVTRNFARMQLAGSEKIANSSFDARNLSKSKALGSGGGKGGFNKWAETKQKTEQVRNQDLKNYTGTSKERSNHREKLLETDREYDKKKKEQNSDERYKKRDEDIAEAERDTVKALHEKSTAQTKEELERANTKLEQAHQRVEQIKKDFENRFENLEKERLAKKDTLHEEHANMFKDKGEARSRAHVDALSTEGTFGLPTPAWKKEIAEKMRTGANKSKKDQAKDLIAQLIDENERLKASGGSEANTTTS